MVSVSVRSRKSRNEWNKKIANNSLETFINSSVNVDFVYAILQGISRVMKKRDLEFHMKTSSRMGMSSQEGQGTVAILGN